MSRDDGFPVADVSTSHLDDPKVRALWRELGPDQGRMARALVLHLAVVLASWGHGCRVTVHEASPVWQEIDPVLVDALVSARLLDRAGRIPIRSWNGWFGPAATRRETLRERWRRANTKRTQGDSAATARIPRGKNDVPLPPSVPSDRTVRPARARARDEAPSNGANGEKRPGALRDAMAAMGLPVPEPRPAEPTPPTADPEHMEPAAEPAGHGGAT